MRINEFTFFVKDDWKVMKSLTLNLGLRYDYYGVPYETSGLMPLPVGGGSAAFGISGRSFDDWMSAWGTRRRDGDPVCRQELPQSRHRVASRRLEQFWSRRWLCLAGSVVWRGEDDRPRRISADVSDWGRIQLHGAGNQRTGQHEQRLVYGGQQRQCVSRSHQAARVDSGAQSSQANAARSSHGEKPADLYSGSEPCDSLRSKPDAFRHAKRRVESIGGPALRRHAGQKATQRGKQHQCAQLPEQRIEGSLRRGAERR